MSTRIPYGFKIENLEKFITDSEDVFVKLFHEYKNFYSDDEWKEVGLALMPFEGAFYGYPFGFDHGPCGKLLPMLFEVGAEPFGYDNGGDPDESVSEDEWNERGRVWEAIVDNMKLYYEPYDQWPIKFKTILKR